MSSARTDIEAVEAANTALYEAVEQGDLEALSQLWLEEGEAGEGAGADGAEGNGGVSVVHPGWPVLTGRGEVLRSYALIMANTEYVQFFLTDTEISVLGDTALVSCTENILSGGPAEEDGSAGPLVGGLVVATNVFRRTGEDEWKLWSHHGSPVLVERDEDDDEDGEDETDLGQGDIDI
ncbi:MULTISPECIES: nuclear transport factor 2 family protein [unclassified Streptomyces]|uniref:nuclear transport factor 2 family protein n=1 Tax=unclassified Streptomyces TaxID=2593676 RepID=UPI002DD7D41A|nr:MULTISPECIES: nuclear transport factor 2 family protein [unclassified Streptomyces]WSA93205.1 nuclear transport factor 2 family protein [Streptomyces sp. NBC_01795]WSB77576.1 nuclear transport factor 2 family protein [Streptomyces sp. NBC_01775]WSS42979.1 nuclear transport factor 2 family protein [Streptomyces sp. NBC_01187]